MSETEQPLASPAGEIDARSAAEAVARRSYGKLIAFLAARTQNVAAAEDALSEAFACALADWPGKGVPLNPEAWLLTVARRKMIDHFRAHAQREIALEWQDMEQAFEAAAASNDIPDQRLALLFVCAHPAIDAGIRAPLMLQVVLGLEAKAIAAAFLTSPAAMGKRLARAREKFARPAFPSESPSLKSFAPASTVCWRPYTPRSARDGPTRAPPTTPAANLPANRCSWPGSSAICCRMSPKLSACSHLCCMPRPDAAPAAVPLAITFHSRSRIRSCGIGP